MINQSEEGNNKSMAEKKKEGKAMAYNIGI